MYIEDSFFGLPPLIPFYPDPRATANCVAASIHRFGCSMPDQDADEISLFLAFSKNIINKIEKLEDSDVPDFKTWLDESNYSGGRKKMFELLRANVVQLDERLVEVDSFIKDEGYDVPKHARAINSYSDESKVLLGPFIKACDKKLFSLKYFVKGTNPKCWPEKLLSLFGRSKVICTDFTSFEAHHSGPFAYLGWLYFKHMFSNLTGARAIRELVYRMVLGVNNMSFGATKVRVDQRLMSGAMWTSSLNGFLNLCIMSYLTLRAQHPKAGADELFSHFDDFRGLFEGDDGICEHSEIDKNVIKRLGIRLDVEECDTFESAGFCSIYCDAESLSTVANPIRVLRHFFLLPVKLANASKNRVLAYLRCKAMSYKYMYPNAPVVGPLSDWVLRETRNIDHRVAIVDFDVYKVGAIKEALQSFQQNKTSFTSPADVAPSSRRIVDLVFGMPEHDQLCIEEVLRSASRGPVDLHLDDYCGEEERKHRVDFLFPYDSSKTRAVFNVPEPLHIPKIVKETLFSGLIGNSGEKPKQVVKGYRLQKLSVPAEVGCSK